MYKQWSQNFKYAIMEENIEQINTLLTNFIKPEKEEEIQEAMALTAEAARLLFAKKKELSEDFEKLKQVQTYVDS